MRTPKIITFPQLLRRNMLLVAFISTLFLGCLWIWQETSRYQSNLVDLREQLLFERKQRMRSIVEGAVAYVEFMRNQTEKRTRKLMRDRVYEAHRLISHLYEQVSPGRSDEEVEQVLREALRPIRFLEERGYYFAVRLDGLSVLCATCDHLEGQNLIDLQDSQGAYVIKEMVALVQQQQEGYYSYSWNNPTAPGEDQPKLSFIKLFEPLDWIIGTGEYLNNVEEDLKKETLQWISSIHYDQDGYVFAGDWSGISLAGPAVGQNMIEVTDAAGKKIVRELIDIANQGEGFLEYVMPALAGERPLPKISFVMGVPEWRWYLGTGMYITDIEAAVEQKRRQAILDLRLSITRIVLVLGCLWLGILLLVSRLNARIQAILGQCTRLFRHETAVAESAAELQSITIQEFRELAATADRIITDRNAAINSLHEKSEELERYFDLSLDLLCIARTDGILVRVNPEWERVLGYQLAELQGSSYLDLVHPDDQPATIEAMETLGRNRQVDNFANRYRCRDGSYRWIEWRSRRVDQLVYAVARDITARKIRENELRTSNELLRAFILHSPIYAFIKEVNEKASRVLNASENFVDMIGIPGSKMAGKSMEELFPADFAAKITADDQMVVREGQSIRLDEEFNNRSYTTFKFPVQVGGKNYLAGYTIDLTDIKQTEQALQESEETFRSIIESSPMGIHLYELREDQLILVGANPAADKLLQVEHHRFLGQRLEEAFPSLASTEMPERYRRAAEAGESWHSEQVNYQDSQIIGAFEVHAFQMSPGRIAVLFSDISPRKIAEEERERLQLQLTQSQKMESVGRLAGGVAHDFNNMLGVILGHAELALRQLPEDHPLHRGLDNIRKAAQRSTDLTRQLLAFARKQTVSPQILALNTTIESLLSMLQRLLGENIKLSWLPGKGLPTIKIDPSQIDQILVNLCINARDAIDFSGEITIETGVTTFDRDYCEGRIECSPGNYVMLAVSDTGHGMDQETLSHLFEPFFTTKKTGKGTGLGLATVYGIVKQNDGFLDVASELGKGSVFRIYFPAIVDQLLANGEQPVDKDLILKGSETVLVVEDEPQVLELTRIMLSDMGYQVLTANSPAEALATAGESETEIDLLLTDVVMPEMHGRSLAEELAKTHPKLKCLFMSGYTADVIAHHGIIEEHICFIAKPFSAGELSRKMRAALQGSCFLTAQNGS